MKCALYGRCGSVRQRAIELFFEFSDDPNAVFDLGIILVFLKGRKRFFRKKVPFIGQKNETRSKIPQQLLLTGGYAVYDLPRLMTCISAKRR